jgi:GcrA cell cycle regulator
MESMGWTEERVELLKKLWLEGLSASQIAGVLGEGVTRNAVIGKVHRLKLTGRAKPASSAPRARTAPRAPGVRRVASPGLGGRPAGGSSGIASMMKSRAMPSGGGGGMIQGATALKMDEQFQVEAYVAPQVQELYIPEDQRLSLLELNEHTCKWPIGDPLTPDFYFCGQHSEEGKPYCDFHSRRAYHQIDKKKR